MALDFGSISRKLGQAAWQKLSEAIQPPDAARSARSSITAPAPSASLPAMPQKRTAYGSAELGTQGNDFLAEAMLPYSTSVVMGSDTLDGQMGCLWDLAAQKAHAMTFGPTRKAGKGVSAIIPALLSYTAGSTLTIDPKGENAWAAADRLRAERKRVVIMDPWDEVNRRYGSKVENTEQLTRFNPLQAIDLASDDFADEVLAVADALIVVPDTVNRHFDESARELVAGCIAACVETAPGFASFEEVRAMITLPDDQLADVLGRIVEKNPNSLAARKLRRFTRNNTEVSNVRATAETQTAFLDSKTLLDAMQTEENPFDLAELATSRVALFLVLPVDRLETHGRWMRMIITLAIRAIARRDTPPKNPVLFLLDEMGTIGRLAMVEQAYGLMAGLGIRLWGFLQDLVQLKGLYPNTWETFISNSSVIQVLKAHDGTTSEYVSRYMGNGTMDAKTGGWTYKQVKWGPGEYSKMHSEAEERVTASLRKKYGRNRLPGMVAGTMVRMYETWAKDGMTIHYKTEWVADEQLIARPLMDPDEVRRLDDDRCILLIPGSKPLLQYRTVYYRHPLFAGLYRENPYFSKAA